MPKVSVIMPCFNDGEYIQQSIDSVLNQDYDDVELIIVDDGSYDESTISLLKRQQDPKVKVFFQSNAGPAAARNRGIKESSGDYILPLDSDDLIEPCYISRAVKILESSLDVGIVYCKADLFGKVHGRWELPNYSLSRMLVSNVIFVSALFRRTDWEVVGGFNEKLKYGIEDYDFWLSILELGREVVCLPDVLFHYRVREESRTKRFEKNVEHVRMAYSEIRKKHRQFFINHFDQYAEAMDSLLLQQTKKIEILKKQNHLIELLYGLITRIPFLKTLLKRMILK